MTGSAPPFFAGRTFEVTYGDLSATNAYDAEGASLRYEITSGSLKGNTATVPCQWRELGRKLYAISWQETDGSTCIHVDDFEAGRSLSFFTAPGGNFYRFEGSLTEIVRAD